MALTSSGISSAGEPSVEAARSISASPDCSHTRMAIILGRAPRACETARSRSSCSRGVGMRLICSARLSACSRVSSFSFSRTRLTIRTLTTNNTASSIASVIARASNVVFVCNLRGFIWTYSNPYVLFPPPEERERQSRQESSDVQPAAVHKHRRDECEVDRGRAWRLRNDSAAAHENREREVGAMRDFPGHDRVAGDKAVSAGEFHQEGENIGDDERVDDD